MKELKTPQPIESVQKLDKITQVIETKVGTIVQLNNDEIHVVRTNEDLDRLVEVLKK